MSIELHGFEVIWWAVAFIIGNGVIGKYLAVAVVAIYKEIKQPNNK
jgi:hypothetical protein